MHTFYEFSFDFEVTIIVLRRYLPEVVRSYLRLRFTKELYTKWAYTISEGQKISVIEQGCPEDTQIEKCIGYLVDVTHNWREALFLYFKRLRGPEGLESTS